MDALFEGSLNPAENRRNVAADLAALLDHEVMAAAVGAPVAGAATGARTAEIPVEPLIIPDEPAAPVPAYAGTGRPTASETAPGAPARETIDVPPLADEAQPVAPEPQSPPPTTEPQPPATPTTQPPQTDSLPVTKRFGAIIMDTVPATTPPAAAEVALRPTEEGLLDLAATKTVMPSGPGSQPEAQPLPAPVERSDDQKAIIISRLNDVLDAGWQKAIHKQIDELYKQVATEFSSPPAQAEKALSLLREARQTLLETPEEYVAVEYRTLQVRAMLDRTRESRKQSRYYGPRVLGYQVTWIMLFLLGLVFAQPLANWIGQLGAMTATTMNDVFPVWNTMMWGGVGGVIGALYHLWWHISDQQDFDRQYLMWYLVQPIMGLVLGGIVYLILAGGFLVLQVNLADSNASTAARLLPYLTAVLGGFRQNFIYEQFDRLIALFTPGSRSGGGGGDTGPAV
ncbi:MAG: hypothetical protein CVU38_12350 [Chloroflexi bacterium HGW-Chloroflexi-1]|nr:MAG: hypothetical protein CVU38_12350 [Chloroflexi bacterium HGW-Chloroflexi-1]